MKDTSHWQRGCDKTPAEAGHGYTLKFPSLSNVALDKFLFAIANPYVRSHFDKSALLAV